MKKLSFLFCVIFLSTFNSIQSQLEGMKDDEEQEIDPLSGRIGNGTVSEHVTFMASLRLKAFDSPNWKRTH
jgi:hypothetical protein